MSQDRKKEDAVNKKKKKSRTTRGVKSLPAKSLSGKQARGIKGGDIAMIPGRLKWENIVLKKG